MRRILLLSMLLLGALAGTVQAQPAAPKTQGAPEVQPLPSEMPDAATVSREVLGPRIPVDEAYGAYQRGYYLTALALALPRAEKDDAAAETLIAEIYAHGLGVAVDLKRAASWYALADKNGDVAATFALGLLYQDGQGVPKNRAKAAELFKKAADAGYPEAQYNMALLYVEGAFAEPNLQKAAQLMKSAAESGIAEARYNYGIMLTEGAGVAPNPAEGAKQIRMAAEAGLTEAQIEYATMRYMGDGVDRDVKDAAAWYKRAANGGNPVAQNRYAKLLASGEGTDRDLQSAAMWRALARRQGLNDPELDDLLVAISKEDLAKGEERARYWPGVPPKNPGGTSDARPLSAVPAQTSTPGSDAADQSQPDTSAAPGT